MTTSRKLTTLKRKWITQNTDLYSWKKKLKVTIELSGIGGMYTVKAKQKQTSKNNNNKNNYKSLNIILPFPFFFFPFSLSAQTFPYFSPLSFLSVNIFTHFFPFSVNLVFLFVCLVPSVLLQLKIIKSVSIWRIPYLNVIELLVYPFSEDFLIMH